MKGQPALTWLVPLAGVLALAAAGAGLFWPEPGSGFTFTTLRGQEADIYGRGVYHDDTVFFSAGFKGMDAVTLAVTLPLLAAAFGLYRRGSLRGGLMLIGVLGMLLYTGASLTFSAAFDRLFLLYTAQFSASLWAVGAALAAFDSQALAARLSPGLPLRGLAIFLFGAGLGTLFLWLSELIGPAVTGEPPAHLGPYTTLFTHGFDIAIITPAAVLAGFCLLRRRPLGLLLAAPILVMSILNGVMVLASTTFQAWAGIIFRAGVYVGLVGLWVLLGAFGLWLAAAFWRALPDPRAGPLRTARAAS
jgi:hypothetical protein